MRKKAGSTARISKKTSEQDKRYTSRLFSSDLDGTSFEQFHQYRRPFVEMERRQSGAEDLDDKSAKCPHSEDDFSKVIQSAEDDYKSAIDHYNAKWQREAKKAMRRRAKMIATVLKTFDAHPFDGPDDWIYRKSFKDNLREALLEYLSDPRGRVHIHDDTVLVSTGYKLTGQSIGGFRVLKPPHDIPGLVIEALVWKSRRTLGLLWTLAEHGEGGTLLRLAQIIVPFVKAINEKASTDVGVLGCWPAGLPFWPVLKSPHHDFDCDHLTLLKSLQVGKDFPFTIAEEARWTARDAIGKWAIHLCQEIEIMQISDYSAEEDSEPWEHKLEKLEQFSGETWKDWWEVAKGLLSHDYVDVVEIPELNKTVKATADRKSPGRIRKRILQALKDKFKSMAWQNKVK